MPLLVPLVPLCISLSLGSTLVTFSSELGGSNADIGQAVACDDQGYIYLGGTSISVDFPLLGPLQSGRGGGYDGFLVKLSPDPPALLYATYLGGNDDDAVTAIQVDRAGRARAGGYTFAADFPVTPGSFQTGNQGGSDGFLAALSADGARLEFATLLGGSGDEYVSGLALGAGGELVVSGSTWSADFPVRNPLQAAHNGASDAFLAELSADGTALPFATWLGGSGQDRADALSLDRYGRAWLAGSTDSADLPVVAPLTPSLSGATDLLLACVDLPGHRLDLLTWSGGSAADRAWAIAADATGVWLAGETDSTDFPVASALQPGPGGLLDAFLARLDFGARAFATATYLGRSGNDQAFAVASDGAGGAWLAGSTSSSGFPAVTPTQPGIGGGVDAFLSHVAAGGGSLWFSSWLGGRGADSAWALATDLAGGVTVVGSTLSTNFPVVQPIQTVLSGPQDSFITRLAPDPCTAPASVGNSLELARQGSNVFARFRNVVAASEYRLYQDTGADWPAPTLVATASDGPGGLTRPLPAPPLAFWTVRAANACGEGPR